MKRKQNIEDAFHSVVPVGTAGDWSVGYSGHTDNSSFFNLPNFEVLAIRNVLDHTAPVTGDAIVNDVYIDYSYLSGTTISGSTSIYSYTVAPTTTTTTVAPTTTTTTVAPTKTTTTTL